MKRASIKMAILIPSISVLFAGIVAVVAVVGILSSRSANDLTERLLNARVNEYTNEFKAISQDMYGTVKTMVPIIANYIDPEFIADVADPRGEVINILSKMLLANDMIVSAWTCWEPGAFDGKDAQYAYSSPYDASGRFAVYAYESGGRVRVEPLVGYDDPVDGDFYQGARSSGKSHVTNPYKYSYGGTEYYIFSICIPVVVNGRVVGAVGADIDLQTALDTMNKGSILDSGYLLTLSPEGYFATHRSSELLMTHYSTTWMDTYKSHIETILRNGGTFNGSAYSSVAGAQVRFLGSGISIGDSGQYWVVCGLVPEATVNSAANTLLWSIIGIGFALLVVAGITILMIVRRNLKDLPLLTSIAEAMSAGDINSAKLETGSEPTRNEIVLLERAFVGMTEGILQQADVLAQIARGDYSVTIPVRSDKDVMNQAINNMLDSTNSTLEQINASTSQVSIGAKQIADGAQMLAQGSTEQAAAVEQLSSSINEIAGKTKTNADMATRAADLGYTIKGSAEKGSAQMDQMMRAVREINEASQSINKVIKVIDNIAFQTNILALNAAVEAARAGQHGKGFAVVAEEVRSLAAKSADAAAETAGLIENSVEKAELGARIATDTAASLVEIVSGINESSRIVNDIAQSSEEQAQAIAQINIGIDQVAQVVQQNSATAEESAAASEEMSGQSDMLEQLIEQFKLKNDTGNRSFNSAPEPKRLGSAFGEQRFSSGGDGGFGKY